MHKGMEWKYHSPSYENEELGTCKAMNYATHKASSYTPYVILSWLAEELIDKFIPGNQ